MVQKREPYSEESVNRIATSGRISWYDLFSRGARDWLRHNEKVREAVQNTLPDLIAGTDLMTGSQDRMVQIPVRLMEHAHFRLARQQAQSGIGQGPGKPGDVLRPARPIDADGKGNERAGGGENGDLKLLLEFKIDDILDWLWDDLKLPDMQAKHTGQLQEPDLVREGLDKRGARSRLDRRRTVKEAIKRRAIQKNPVPFTDQDLRFRQLVFRPKPSSNAVVLFAIDVSASMTQTERKLAKTFFFFALQGIRKTYAQVETRFIAHTTQAWEFSESEFFKVSGSGGTSASAAFNLALDLIRKDYDPSCYNIYLFYASDGENFKEDRIAATQSLARLAAFANYVGYLETIPGMPHIVETEIRRLFAEQEQRGAAVGSCTLNRIDDVWQAIRHFFTQRSKSDGAD